MRYISKKVEEDFYDLLSARVFCAMSECMMDCFQNKPSARVDIVHRKSDELVNAILNQIADYDKYEV